MTSRKILFLLPTAGFGGAELHSLTLARHMKARGDTPVVAFPFSASTARIYQQCLDDGIEMLDMPIAQVLMASPAENIAEQSRRLRARLVPEDFDAVIVAAPSPLTAAGLLDALADTDLPGICIFHLVADMLVIPPDAALVMLRALRGNFRFVAVSEFSRDMLCKALSLDPLDGFIDYIPNGSQVEVANPDFDLCGTYLNPGLRPVVSVGRIHPQKGCQFLVRALPAVLEAVPEARFLWFGEGPDQELMERLAKELGVSHALHFPGFTSRSAEIMHAAHLVVLPTLYEGLSLTLLEAMHCGAAILTTDASYQDRILTDGLNGAVVPRGNVNALAERIIELLQDKEQTDSLRQNVLELARYYSEDRMLADYEQLLDSLLASPRGTSAFSENASIAASWAILGVKADGSHDLRLERDGELQLLSGSWLLEPPAGLSKIGMRYVVAGHVETWIAAQDMSGGGQLSWGALLLDLLARDRQHLSMRAFALYDLVLAALSAPGATDRAVLTDLLEAILRFQGRYGFGLALSLAPLERLADAGLRRTFLTGIAEREAAPIAVSGADLPKFVDRPLNRAERALLLEGLARARGDMAGERKYGAIRAALEGGQPPLSMQGHPNRVMFFAEYFNYPPVNGGDRRMLSLMQGYQGLGFEVHFCSLAPARQKIAKETQALLMRGNLGIQAHYLPLSEKTDAGLRAAHTGLTNGDNTIAQFYDADTWREVRRLSEMLRPALIHVNYCYFAWVASATEGLGAHRVLDTHDLISRRVTLNRELLRLCGNRRPNDVTQVPGAIHAPDRFIALRYNILPEEIEALNQFETVLMISAGEAEVLRPLLPRDSLRSLEMHMGYAPAMNLSSGARPVRAFYAGGNNLYNMVGAAALRNHILPYLEARLDPEAHPFALRISGDVGSSIPPHNLIERIGRIPDIDVAYIDVDFALCPIPAGTGQNVKIIEAMSRGIPVVAYNDIGRSANIVSGVNGLLASTLAEFREIVLELIHNQDLRETLKASTRAWAEQYFVMDGFRDRLKTALETTGFDVSTMQRKR